MTIYSDLIKTHSLNNKYTKWYLSIIETASSRIKNTTKRKSRQEAVALLGYVERHHIWPQCLCESKDDRLSASNQVYLTAREHFVCHHLLTKMFEGKAMFQMMAALAAMAHDKEGRKLTAGQFDVIRKVASQIPSNRKGKHLSEEHKQAMRKPKSTTVNMGRYVRTDETKMKTALASTGVVKSEESKRKQSESMKGHKYPTVACPHCGEHFGKNILHRHVKYVH